MKAKESALKILNFTVFKSCLDFVPAEDLENADLYSLPIDITFDIYEPKDESDYKRMIEMSVKINNTKKMPGYSVEIIASGFFDLSDPTEMNEKEKDNLLGVSLVSIMISNIRGFLRNLTSYGIYGTYILPSIDMNQLLKEKAKEAMKRAKIGGEME